MSAVTDAALEGEISLAYERFVSVSCPATWAELSRLILRRSPEEVERLERAKGLLSPKASYEQALL